MLHIIDRKTNELGGVLATSFQELKIFERKNLEKWIKDHPEILGEEVGKDLFIITTEYSRFDKSDDRLDILAIDTDGKLVIIELKRDEAPSNTELQAIKYAAFCSNFTLDDVVDIYINNLKFNDNEIEKNKAREQIENFIQNEKFEKLDNKPRIILVAGEFRQETTASVMWLRSFEVDITCVKLKVYNLQNITGKDMIAIDSNVIIPLPEAKDFMIGRERKEAEESEMNERQKFLYGFYSNLIERFKKECPGITERGGTKDGWLSLPIGYSRLHFEWNFKKRPQERFEISLDLEKSDYEENCKVLKEIEKYKEELESKINEKFSFNYQQGEKWCRLYVVNEDIKDLEKLQNWIIETTKKFYNHLKPIVDEVMNRKV